VTRPKRGGGPEDTVTVTVSRPGVVTGNVRARGNGAACLVCIYGAELGKRWALTGGTITIGRSSSSDIPLDQDSVSRAHARIMRRGDFYVVSDLGSTNGTFVGDEVIKERALKNGDRIRIGRTIIKFLSGGDVESSYHDEIYRLVTVDGLTQVYNRRYFNEAIEREISRTKRGSLPLSLILLDIDHFKKTNDTYGHVMGDAVLRQLASELGPKVREMDVLARTGGEEFGVILPEASIDFALVTAEALRHAAMAGQFGVGEQKLECTISLGVAERQGDEPAERLYERADAALYRAKQGGRNRVAQ
jgi:diguanylate cyclase (GGDEF)-like protein